MNETLIYLFEAYFHQDWRDDYVSSLDVVRAFCSDEQIEAKTKLKNALFELLEQGDLSQDIFNKLGGSFRPEREGMSVEYWIKQAIKVIQ